MFYCVSPRVRLYLPLEVQVWVSLLTEDFFPPAVAETSTCLWTFSALCVAVDLRVLYEKITSLALTHTE